MEQDDSSRNHRYPVSKQTIQIPSSARTIGDLNQENRSKIVFRVNSTPKKSLTKDVSYSLSSRQMLEQIKSSNSKQPLTASTRQNTLDSDDLEPSPLKSYFFMKPINKE